MAGDVRPEADLIGRHALRRPRLMILGQGQVIRAGQRMPDPAGRAPGPAGGWQNPGPQGTGAGSPDSSRRIRWTVQRLVQARASRQYHRTSAQALPPSAISM
jgi:hypothetical protein